MGASDGDNVGGLVGFCDGACVGACDGACDGACEGTCEGACDGILVGVSDGDFEGAFEGKPLGTTLGLGVGKLVDNSVGAAVSWVTLLEMTSSTNRLQNSLSSRRSTGAILESLSILSSSIGEPKVWTKLLLIVELGFADPTKKRTCNSTSAFVLRNDRIVGYNRRKIQQ